MLPCHCKAGDCCGEAEYAAEVIHSGERPIPQILGDSESPDDARYANGRDEVAPVTSSFSGLGSVEQEESVHCISPVSPVSVAWRKMTSMSHMEIDYETMRGIPLHRALRYSELWTSPNEIRRRNRAAEAWELSARVKTLDIFLSHTWQTKGRWKVLALMMQMGWFQGLLGWSIGLAVMLSLRAFDLVGDLWRSNVFILAGEEITVSTSSWTVFWAEVSMMIGLCLSPYLPFKRQTCFLDIACIHQGQNDLFERGLYGIGGCLAAAQELRVLYSPEYLSSLWCWFELVGFRKANPSGKIAFSPLFIERSAFICILILWWTALSINVVLAYADIRFRQGNIILFFTFIFCLPTIFVVHTMRHNYREKARLIFDLKNFDVEKLKCASDFDRAFILSAIDAWYGSRETFMDFVRSDLREELLSLLPCPHLPCAYAALILSSMAAWTLDMSLSVYKSGAVGHGVLRHFVCFAHFFGYWFWFGLNSIFYLSDRTAALGRTRLLDCCITLAVASVTLLWFLVGFALCISLARSTQLLGLVLYVAFSMLLPLFILDGFKVCRKRCRT